MTFFDIIVKRVTNFPVQSYEKNREDLHRFFKENKLFKLSVLLSSISLYNDIEKDKTDKIKNALKKYFIRAHFNPTPFGTFNSVGTLQWNDKTHIIKKSTIHLNVKYDNTFLTSVYVKDSTKDLLSRTYTLNPTIHFLQKGKICFYKSEILTNDKVEIKFVEIDYDEDLQWLMDQFKKNTTIDELVKQIMLDGFEESDIRDYLLTVIDSGLIIDQFIFNSFTKKLSNHNPLYPSSIVEKNNHLLTTTEALEHFTNQYISNQESLLKDNPDQKNFFAINAFDEEQGTMDAALQEKIRKFIDFTITYNSHTTYINESLTKFITKVSEKYNDGLIPLVKVFNPNSGLNYTSNISEYKLKLADEIVLKIVNAKDNNLYLNLPITDDKERKRNNLPNTFTVVVELLTCKSTGNKITYIRNLGANSALNLVARFSKVTNPLCQDIINYEKKVHDGKIIADISCIGLFRSVNINAVEQLYDYSLPINTSYIDESKTLLLSDIYIHLSNGKLNLVSKKHKKQILPKLTTAINTKLSDSEMYRFLSDLEFYNQELYDINFNFNSYDYLKSYVPRIYLDKETLLHPAQLLLAYDNYTLEEFTVYLNQRIKESDFSTIVNLNTPEGNLTLDTTDNEDVIVLFQQLKTTKKLYINEFIYQSFSPAIVDNDGNNYPHELVVSVKNTDYYRDSYQYDEIIEDTTNLSENVPIVSDWLYLDLYRNTYSNNDILKHIHETIISKNIVNKFFFVNYKNTEDHIRVRFQTTSIEVKELIIQSINQLKINSIISKYHIVPYEQEIHRYGGLELMEYAESIFDLDSRDFIEKIVLDECDDETRRILSILKIKNYLEFFGFTLDEMINHCERSIESFSREFELTPQLRKTFNKDYADIKAKIDSLDYTNFLNNNSLKGRLGENLPKMRPTPSHYAWILIHMSMNRHFNENQRFNEFKSYYMTKSYLNQLKYSKKNIEIALVS